MPPQTPFIFQIIVYSLYTNGISMIHRDCKILDQMFSSIVVLTQFCQLSCFTIETKRVLVFICGTPNSRLRNLNQDMRSDQGNGQGGGITAVISGLRGLVAEHYPVCSATHTIASARTDALLAFQPRSVCLTLCFYIFFISAFILLNLFDTSIRMQSISFFSLRMLQV